MKTILAFLVIASIPAAVSAQSLLGDNTRSPIDPPAPTSYKKHDHLVVTVFERSRALSATELKTDRRSRFEVGLDDFIRFDNPGKSGSLPRLRAAELAGDPGIDLDARFRQDNTGRTGRRFDLIFTITAEIIDVRPNGILVIQAIKRRKVNADEETIRLTGDVSPKSVINGRIRSDAIANLDITYDGSGSVSDGTNPGWLGWILSKLWPF